MSTPQDSKDTLSGIVFDDARPGTPSFPSSVVTPEACVVDPIVPLVTARLNKVEPKKTLVCGSAPCEHKAAIIRNQTVEDLEEQNVGAIAYRYLQNRRGQRNTMREGLIWLLYPVYGVLHTIPNFGNMGRYKKTKRACKEFLRAENKELFNKIREIDFSSKGMDRLAALLIENGLDASAISSKEGKIFKSSCTDKPNCWNLEVKEVEYIRRYPS